MNEIKCPKCGEIFRVDESDYAELLKSVRTEEFDRELRERETLLLAKQAMEREKWEAEAETEKQRAALDAEKRLSGKDAELSKLRAALALSAQEKEDAVQLAVAQKEKEISDLKGASALDREKAQREQENALQEKERQLENLRAELKGKETEQALRMEGLRKEYDAVLKQKEEEVERLKDMKAKLSTKMLGETLEQHCEIEFNRIRSVAFPFAYFEKDNDARTGSKGDYVFRDFEDGEEFISIMFEMKNEADTTATKKKNEDFFKELDKDRREKKCEYAVLVSLLEKENEFYNGGIVDVSHRYEKMYVIRPQFFLPLISLLRNAARNSVQYRKELSVMKSQNVDVSNFENALNDFRFRVSEDYRLAGQQYNSAVDSIDKAIRRLEQIKEDLRLFEKHLRLANDKAQDISVKKLTKDNPTMKAMFDSLHEGN